MSETFGTTETLAKLLCFFFERGANAPLPKTATVGELTAKPLRAAASD